MKDFVIKPAPIVSLPIIGAQTRFPVRRVFCVGKNYAAHAAEMGDTTGRDPVFFTKSRETIRQHGETIPYPPNSQNVHFEVELVLAIGPDGVWGYGVGIDFTRRDLQAAAKAAGQPWDRAKNFTASAPVSALTPAENVDLRDAVIELSQNGTVKQSAPLSTMIWSVTDIIERLRDDLDLQSGDLIFTGTPAGVGPIARGDRLACSVTGLAPLDITIG